MNIDIRTLAIVLAITNILQAIAIYLQYKANKSYQGIGWLFLGFSSMTGGYIFLLLRDLVSIKLITIIFANTLILLGPIFIYIGIMRFLNKKENRGIIISIFAIFILSFFYFTYFNSNITLRTVIIYAAVATIVLLTAQSLYLHKTYAIRTSAYFNASIFFINGIFFMFRAVETLTFDPVHGLFTPATIQTISFLVAFIYGVLLTFGLIIMVNQRLNAEMREAKESSELIFNITPDAVLVTRLTDGVIVVINEGFTEMTGYTRAEIIGKSTLEVNIWKNPIDRQLFVTTLQKKNFCNNMEAVFQRKDGSQLHGIISAKIIVLQGTSHIISVTRDITARKKEEEARRELEKQITHNDRIERLGVLAGGIAHDFNNILTVILGNTDIALYRIDTTNPLRKNIENIQIAGKRAKDLVQKILLFSRQSESSREYVVVALEVENTLRLLRPVIPSTINIKVEVDTAEATVMMDTTELNQVIMNLCVNAVYSMRENITGTLTIAAYRISLSDCDWIKLVVRDTGSGIPPEIINRIFDPFFTSKAVNEGTGLGLSVVHGIIQRAGGSIEVESEPGSGSSFRILLPEVRNTDPGNGIKDLLKPVLPRDAVRSIEKILINHPKKRGI